MTAPFFSIVIANYNYGRFIEEAIKSVLDQSCQDFELIIVDGASTDDSVDIIKKYASRIAWWVSEPDTGQSNAFNKGFSHAGGRFLTWLNADDLLLPGTLEKAKDKLERNPECLWLTGNFLRFLDDGTIIECKWGPHVYPGLLQRPNSPIVAYGPTTFYASDLFREVGGMDETLKYGMDTDLWLRFMARGVKQARLNHYCWAFRMHEESMTAEFGEHVHEGEKLAEKKMEKQRIREKNGYIRSRRLRLICLLMRVLDGSLLVSLKNQMYWRGRKLEEMIN